MIISHTILRDFETCPRQCNHKHIAKDLPKEPATKQQTWGREVHKGFELRINKGIPLPDEMKQYEQFCDFGKYSALAEIKLGITQDGKATDFWDKSAFGRGIIDCMLVFRAPTQDERRVACLVDWKTGKRWEDPAELAFHAVLLRAHYPEMAKIYGWYVWLQDMAIGRRHDLSNTEQKFEEIKTTVAQINRAKEMDYWPPKQGPLCDWCPVKSCEFHP